MALHSSLNISKGTVRCPALNRQSCEHIMKFMGEKGVTDVRRISVFRNGVKKPTYTFVFTFNTPVLPSVVKIGFIQIKGAKIRNRYNQVPHPTQDTNGKVTNSQQTPQTRAKRSALSPQVTTKHI